MTTIAIATSQKREVIDITSQIERQVSGHGAVVINVLHTTAALTTADLDPGTDQDLLDALEDLIADKDWRHPHDPAHTPDHLLASLIGPSVSLPVADGRLVLGSWQRVVLVELDGPRERKVAVTMLAK